MPDAPASGTEASWFKSFYSGDTGGGSCVEAKRLAAHIGIRDSKQKNGPALAVPASAWTSFIAEIQAGRLG